MQQPSPGPFLVLEFLQLLSLANNCIFGTIPLDTGGELVGGRGRAALPVASCSDVKLDVSCRSFSVEDGGIGQAMEIILM